MATLPGIDEAEKERLFVREQIARIDKLIIDHKYTSLQMDKIISDHRYTDMQIAYMPRDFIIKVVGGIVAIIVATVTATTFFINLMR